MSSGDAGPPWLHVVLVHPEIPGNTGSIARVCAGTPCRLHLVRPLGFSLEDRYLKRAGLDYWPHVDLRVHASAEEAQAAAPRRWLFTKGAARALWEVPFERGDALVFGCETTGLPAAWLDAAPERQVRIPIETRHIRSLNLANAASVAIFEALRQLQWVPTEAPA